MIKIIYKQLFDNIYLARLPIPGIKPKYLLFTCKHLHCSLMRGDESRKEKENSPPHENQWNWIPPRDSGNKGKSNTYEIPIKKRILLTTDEVQKALLSLGAENIVIININGSLGSVSHFIIATGRSTRILRKMGDTIVQAVRINFMQL